MTATTPTLPSHELLGKTVEVVIKPVAWGKLGDHRVVGTVAAVYKAAGRTLVRVNKELFFADSCSVVEGR